MKVIVMTIATAVIGLFASVAAYSNPCPGWGFYFTNVFQTICFQSETNCSAIFMNYRIDRVCEYYCCYDEKGNLLTTIISACREWEDAGCCGVPFIGTYYPGQCPDYVRPSDDE